MFKRYLGLLALVLCLGLCGLSARASSPDLSLSQGQVLRGRFVQKHYAKDVAEPVVSEGHFVLAPGYGLIWAIEKPIPFSFVVTPTGVTQYVGSIPLLRQPAAKAVIFEHMLTLVLDVFSGRWSNLDSDFSVSEETGKEGWVLTLNALPSGQAARVMKSLIVHGRNFVNEATLVEVKGNEDKVSLLNQQVTKGKPTIQELALFQEEAH